MGSAGADESPERPADPLDAWFGHEPPTSGRAVIEDLARAALAAYAPAGGGTADLRVERGSRRIAAFLVFALAVVALLAAAVAYGDPGPVTVGFALLTGAGTAALWWFAARGGATVLATGSRLEVVRGRSRHVFDLADPRLRLDVTGRPGERGWRVRFHRRGMAPYVVDASLVEPAAFMRVLHAHRPEVPGRPR